MPELPLVHILYPEPPERRKLSPYRTNKVVSTKEYSNIILDKFFLRWVQKNTRNDGTSLLPDWLNPTTHRQLIQLWLHWKMVMGENLASLAFPLGWRKNVLFVGGEDNFVLQELTYQKEEILQRVNAFMDAPQESPFFTQVKLRLSKGEQPLSSP